MMRWLLVLMCSCTVKASYPTTLAVGSDLADRREEIEAAAKLWTDVGSHLSVVYVDVDRVRDGLTPVHWASIGRPGLTSELGVQLDVDRVGEYFTRVAAHEFGHVLGLGAPADLSEHIHVAGDLMCDTVQCAGDVLSDADVAAWRAGGAR